MSETTQTTNRSEAARKANATRRANKEAARQKAMAEFREREAKFDAIGEDAQNEIISSLDDIVIEFDQAVEDFENEELYTAEAKLQELVNEHGYDVVKAAMTFSSTQLGYNAGNLIHMIEYVDKPQAVAAGE
jgi:wobble nucleotide-excising tRNase